MRKIGQARILKSYSFRFRLGVAAFLLGAGVGYVFTGDQLTADQMVALGERVKTVFFARSLPAKKEG